jgi:tetratricopeptide (TPR) repeat protein
VNLWKHKASEWADYLARKFTNKDDIALMRDPIPILTFLFFEDLNEIARKHPILLCIDNFEATRQELQDWLLHLREYRPSLNIRIILAGRNPPGAMWDPLRKVTLVIYLDVFTQQEAEIFLDTYHVTDIQHRQEIIKYSGRLPVLMSWLAASDTIQANVALPTQDIVERFLRWISEESFRYAAEIAAFPRIFNIDTLTYILKEQATSIDAQVAFTWLQTMPFVQQLTEGWCYHDVVRRMILRHQALKSPQSYQSTHRLLADFCEMQCQTLSIPAKQTRANVHWRKHMLSYLYHLLLADPHRHWSEVISQIIISIHTHSSFAFEILETLDDVNIHDTLDQDQENLIKALRQQLRPITKGDFQDGFALFEQLCHVPDLSPEAKGYTYAFRGEHYRQCQQWEKALSDFGEALQYVSDDVWIMSHRSDVYRMTERYEEALADLNHVLTIDNTSSWAFSIRAQVYRQMGRMIEALSDLNHAIDLDEKDTWSIACRGHLHHQMGNFSKALTDFNHVIAIDQNDAWSITQRARTHLTLENYKESIADSDQAIKLGESSMKIWLTGKMRGNYTRSSHPMSCRGYVGSCEIFTRFFAYGMSYWAGA